MQPFDKKPNFRHQRIAEQIQHALGQILLTRMSDPCLKTISISQVKMSKDLSIANIYVSSFSEQPIKNILILLNESKPFLQRELAHHLNLRITPQLRFYYDESFATAARIHELLRGAEKKNHE